MTKATGSGDERDFDREWITGYSVWHMRFKSTGYESFHTPRGVWKGLPDPAFVHLFHEIPHPALFFIAFPNLVFSFPQNTYLKKG